MIVELVPPAQRRKDGTGGSTGVPLQYWSGPEERGWRESGLEHYMIRLGIARGTSTAFLWGHHLDRQARGEWRERVRDRVTNRRWFDCFRLSPEVLLAYHQDMQRFRPAVLVSYASALDALALVLLERGLRAGYPTDRIVTGAEKLWPHQRARIEQVFDARVHERYGSREAGLIGMQLDPCETLAFDVDFANAMVEPEGETPESEVLLTKLRADAMPMLRYRMGDGARFAPGSRPGHPVWRIEEVLGRRLDRLALPDGRWLHGVGIPHLMKDFPIREFQIRQQPDFTIDVLVVPNSGFREADGEAILAALRHNLPGLRMQLTRVAAVPRNRASKWHPVVSLAAVPGGPPPADPRSSPA
jgi:phenylacetate-CoA ligase